MFSPNFLTRIRKGGGGENYTDFPFENSSGVSQESKEFIRGVPEVRRIHKDSCGTPCEFSRLLGHSLVSWLKSYPHYKLKITTVSRICITSWFEKALVHILIMKSLLGNAKSAQRKMRVSWVFLFVKQPATQDDPALVLLQSLLHATCTRIALHSVRHQQVPLILLVGIYVTRRSLIVTVYIFLQLIKTVRNCISIWLLPSNFPSMVLRNVVMCRMPMFIVQVIWDIF